jgi:hypothetical protein
MFCVSIDNIFVKYGKWHIFVTCDGHTFVTLFKKLSNKNDLTVSFFNSVP